MARPRPSNPTPRKAAVVPPKAKPSRRWVGRVVLHLLTLGVVVGGLAYATLAARQYVEAEATPAGPLAVVLENRPAWMSDYLAGQVAAAVPRRATSPFDHGLLVAAVARLRADPWVRQVRQVRRAYGKGPGDTLVVDCDYRAPAALVRWGDSYWMVDNDGVKLPDQFSAAAASQVTRGRDGRTVLRVVTGVRGSPPETGRRWAGGDLAAGLDAVKLFDGKPYLDEVTGVDVTNYGGRVNRGDPQLVLDTRYGTQVWWGRPPLADDFFVEVPVARKLAILKAVVRQFGRVDGGKAWLDVRFDTGLLPSDPPADPAR